MMEALEKLVYNIAENVQKEHDLVFLERLRYMVHYYRALLIRRDDAKGRKLDQQFLQLYQGDQNTGIRMIEQPNQGFLLMRSEMKIPEVIRLNSGPAIRIVTNLSQSCIIHPIEFEALRSFSYGKYTGSEPRYYYRDQYLYVINSMVENLTVEAAFEFPDQVPDNDRFPVPLDFVYQITAAILSGELKVITQNPTSDDVTVNG